MRIANRVVAAVVALVLLVLGIVVAVEIFLAGIGQSPWLLPHDEWYENARTTEWNDTSNRWLFILLSALGLGLLVLQFIRRGPRTLPLQRTDAGATDADISRSSVERSLARAAEEVDGIAGAKVRVSEAQARVHASTNRRSPGDLQARVADAVRSRLGGLGLARPPDVSVAVRHRETR